jgi:hypothetical protein
MMFQTFTTFSIPILKLLFGHFEKIDHYKIYYYDFCQVHAIMNPCELMACPCTTSTPNALKKSF